MLSVIKKALSELYFHVGKKRFFSMFIFVPLIGLFLTLEPLFFGKIIAQLELFYQTEVFDTDAIIKITIAWFLFVIVGQWVRYFIWQEVTTRSLLIDYTEWIKKYCKHALDMSMWEYLGKNIGSIYKLIDRGTENKLFFFFSLFDNYIFNVVTIIFISIILFSLHVKMALISLCLLPFMLGLGYYFISVTAVRQRELSKKWEEIFNVVWNAMSNFGLYKILCLDVSFTRKIFQKSDETYTEQMSLNKYWNFSEIYTVFFIMITRILVLWSGIIFVKNGELSLAELFVIFSYIGWIYFPLWFMFRELRNSVRQLTEVKRMYDDLGSMELEDDLYLGKSIKGVKGNIEFKNVDFWYSDDRKILENINLDIKKGQKVALVGNTWAGKSTIVNLILRFWEIKNGEILLDGNSIKDIKKSSLRKHIWVVSQDNSLFNLSIEENLKFANPKATKKEIEMALKNAQADFVFWLKDWIKTVIWERGLKLSGWEKQRISIARLFLKNPEILILDEATSALDNATEKKIEKALKKLMKGKTSIIIAHRLSTIQHADTICMLENGKIVESWNYEELMKKKWKFYNLANPDKLILG